MLGDGIMALFGAPIAHKDHAVCACYAALAMQTALRGLSEPARRGLGVEVQVRIGIHSGEVVVLAALDHLPETATARVECHFGLGASLDRLARKAKPDWRFNPHLIGGRDGHRTTSHWQS